MRRIVVAAAVMAALVLVGCTGGGGDAERPAAETPTTAVATNDPMTGVSCVPHPVDSLHPTGVSCTNYDNVGKDASLSTNAARDLPPRPIEYFSMP